jgi:predicted transcriptional regulator
MTRVVSIARAVALLHKEPMSIRRLSALTCVGEETVRDWITTLRAANLIRPVGIEERGQRGIKATKWEWVQ